MTYCIQHPLSDVSRSNFQTSRVCWFPNGLDWKHGNLKSHLSLFPSWIWPAPGIRNSSTHTKVEIWQFVWRSWNVQPAHLHLGQRPLDFIQCQQHWQINRCVIVLIVENQNSLNDSPGWMIFLRIYDQSWLALLMADNRCVVIDIDWSIWIQHWDHSTVNITVYLQ